MRTSIFRIFVVIILLILLMISFSASAQTLPEHTKTGILIDRVLPFSHLEDLDGTADSPPVTPERWRQAVYEIKRSAEVEIPWISARDLQKTAQAAAPKNTIHLSFMAASYDRLTENGPVSKQVVTFAPVESKSWYGANITFVLNAKNLLLHQYKTIKKFELDCADGLGRRMLSLNKPIEVNYQTTGQKVLELFVEFDDGSTAIAKAFFEVARLDTPDPHQTWAIDATVPWDGSTGSGQAYIYLAPGHTTVENPVVVVEGFDLENNMDWPVLYDLLNQENMLEDLLLLGYDAVVLDFTEATQPIQRNAFVLTELLSTVNTTIGSDQTVALVGASMGGLVSRYALTWMEEQQIDHQVRTFISFDSPQTGANIPLGLQYWLYFFQDQAEAAQYLLSRLDTAAARQMLLYHYTEPAGTAGSADPMMASFQANLAAIGNWPTTPRLVSVANGTGAGQNQGFAAGDQLIRYEYRSLLADIDGNVWAVPDGFTNNIFQGMLDLIWPLPDSDLTVTDSGNQPWDNAPGGKRPTMAQMDTTPVPYGDIVALHTNHCFIPTISALALDVQDPFFDINNAPDLLSLTRFDAVYYPQVNQEHIFISPENKQWFVEEISRGVTAVPDSETPGKALPELYGAAPNPFNPKTEIHYNLPQKAHVNLVVCDLAGRVVNRLKSGVLENAGPHKTVWDGRDAAGKACPSGVYLSILQVEGFSQSQSMVLVR